jgi:hypothetical protein
MGIGVAMATGTIARASADAIRAIENFFMVPPGFTLAGGALQFWPKRPFNFSLTRA